MPNPLYSKELFARRLRTARMLADYPTQAQAAEAIGVSRSYYGHWENENNPAEPSASQLVAICKALDTNSKRLLGI